MSKQADDKMEVKESEQLSRYSNNQKILVVGEGDFSFSLSLAKALGSATNITATSLNVREGLGRYYNNGDSNVEELERLGCKVVHGVNVHTMSSHYRLDRYDLIVFDYPHAGKQRDVLRGVMENGREMLKDESGEIHITHKSIYPFNERDIKALAEEIGLRFIKMMQFNKWGFHGFPFEAIVTLMFKK